MRVIYKDSETQREQDYPNSDISTDVIGKNEDIQFYFIEEITIENPNTNRYNVIQKTDELTNDNHSLYPHLKICKRGFELIEKSQQEIIDRINSEYGNYVDTNYPQVVRMNHIIEQIQGPSDERSQYIASLQEWLLQCKKQKEQKIKDYVENGIFPISFTDYIVKP